jgi:hypothetical protein
MDIIFSKVGDINDNLNVELYKQRVFGINRLSFYKYYIAESFSYFMWEFAELFIDNLKFVLLISKTIASSNQTTISGIT